MTTQGRRNTIFRHISIIHGWNPYCWWFNPIKMMAESCWILIFDGWIQWWKTIQKAHCTCLRVIQITNADRRYTCNLLPAPTGASHKIPNEEAEGRLFSFWSRMGRIHQPFMEHMETVPISIARVRTFTPCLKHHKMNHCVNKKDLICLNLSSSYLNHAYSRWR